MENETPNPPKLISEADAAALIGMSVSWLRGRRYSPDATGPPFYMLGSRARYDRAEVIAWIEAQRNGGDGE